MTDYIGYAKHIDAPEKVLSWIAKRVEAHLKDNPENQEEIEHIIDYLASPDAPNNITAMTYEQAQKNAGKWLKTLQKRGGHIKESAEDTEIVLDFKDGFKIVKLIGKNAFDREGYLMAHCVGSYYERCANGQTEIYSLRDKDNMPHATMEKDQQVKGKGNGDIHPRYVNYVVKFLEHIGMSVGDSEMKHLGYKVPKWNGFVKNKLYRDRYLVANEEPILVDGVKVVRRATLTAPKLGYGGKS